jgi:ATP-dependent helicase/nuclease subunit A
MSEQLTDLITAKVYDRRGSRRMSLEGEQLAAVKARKPVVTLLAGAGSGKTTVLVERFLDLVITDGVSPMSILAITYTEKAAAEMKERIVRRFEEHGDDANRRRAEAAYISTIHGFCARLLRENPLAAGIDPAFGIIDDMRLGFFLDQERERMFGDDWFLQVRELLPARYNSHQERLFELIRDCVFSSREFGKGISAEESLDIDSLVSVAMERLDRYCAELWSTARAELLRAASDICAAGVSGPKSLEQHRRLGEMFETLATLDAPDADWAREFCNSTSFTRGIKDLDVRARVKLAMGSPRARLKALGDIDRVVEEELEREQIAPLKTGIYRQARELRERYEQMKQEHSLLDFEDLQRLALRLLGRTDTRAEYVALFRHILLDEAQDTNQVQKAIVDAIKCEDDQCLFAVGDIKQSIYGFRGADVTIFGDMHRAAGGGRLQLQDNYRSRAEILGFVNSVGDLLWQDDTAIEYAPLIRRFDYPNGERQSPRVELMLVERQRVDSDDGRSKPDSSRTVHEREALAIAGRIRDLVEGTDGVAPLVVYDRHNKEYRNVRYGDIAILTSRRTHFGEYERVLGELGIPAVADGGRGFFSGREVQDILAALRVVANPYDEVALLATLRSPLFGWSDEDLVLLRTAGKRDLWHACASGFVPQGESADGAAYDTLASLRRLASALPPVRLIQVLLQRTAYIASLLRNARGRPAAANVQKLLEFARQSADVDGPDLRRFIHRAQMAEIYLAQESEASIAAEGEDVVLLGTIHGSKGLEWPVVVLAGLDADFSKSDNGSFYSAADEVLILEPRRDGKIVKSASQQLILEIQKKRDEREGRRLFYVGMTRAREYLIMSGENPSADEAVLPPTFGAPVKWLAGAVGATAADVHDRDVSIGDAIIRLSLATEASVASMRGSIISQDQDLTAARRSVSRGEIVNWSSADPERTARIAATVRELVVGAPAIPAVRRSAVASTTVTRLVYFERCPMVYYFNLVLQIEEHPRRRRKSEVVGARGYSAVELGTVVHEMLERADFDAVPTEEARRLVAGHDNTSMLQADRERVERMLTSVLADPIIDRARQATLVEREYPFYLNLNGTLVHGVLDLVFADSDGRGVVVDYKSNDLAAPDRVNVLSQYYRPQIEMYALAVSKAGLVRAEEATLYFLNKSIARTVNVDVAQLDATEGRMSDALARISRGDWSTEPGEKCRNCGYRKRGFCEIGKRFID